MYTRRRVKEMYWSVIYRSKNVEVVCPSYGKQKNKLVYSGSGILYRSESDPVRATYINMDKPHKI